MKRFLLIFTLMSSALICRAQYYTSQPYVDYAAIASTIAANEEARMLNNIRFDVNAFRNNETVYSRYLDFCKNDELYNKRRTTWNTVAIVGVVGICIGCLSGETDASIGIMSVSSIVGCIGLIGSYCANENIRQNKKDMIYYLKATNNGVGIITVF